jgi:hypothetical protein
VLRIAVVYNLQQRKVYEGENSIFRGYQWCGDIQVLLLSHFPYKFILYRRTHWDMLECRQQVYSGNIFESVIRHCCSFSIHRVIICLFLSLKIYTRRCLFWAVTKWTAILSGLNELNLCELFVKRRRRHCIERGVLQRLPKYLTVWKLTTSLNWNC